MGWPVVAPHADGRLICNINFAAHSAVDPIHPEHRSLARAFNDESEANARLIAAAPELYEALKEACQEIADLRRFANNNGGMFDSETFSPGLAAIAKVEGRS